MGAANGPGAATNSIVVQSGSSASTNAAILPTSITLSGTGTGVSTNRFAFWANIAQGSGKTFTFSGSRTMFLSMNSLAGATTHAAKFTGTTTSETVLVAAQTTTLTNTANDFVAGGNGVELQSHQTNGDLDGRYYWILSGDISDTAVFGNAANSVYIESSGAFQTTSATTTRTISRNFKIDGHNSTLGTPASDIFNNSTTRLQLSGTVNLLGTGGFPATFDSATGGLVALTGTLTGAGGISVKAGGTLELATSLTLSSYTGTVAVAAGGALKYGISGITGAATFASTAIIDSVSSSLLTLLHTSYTISSGSLTFTGTNALSLGSGAITTTSNLTFSTLANRLTINGNIAGAGVLTKSSSGALALGGTVSGFSAVSHTGGTLELNSAGSAGNSTQQFTITAATANTLDSTTGAALAQTGIILINGDFTWGGSADLTFGSGLWTWGNPLTINFLNGKTGILKIPGNAGTPTATRTLSFGGTPVNGSRSRFWLGGTNACLSTGAAGQLLQVTAGYFRVSDSAGLGNAVTTMWTVASGAALEVDGSISPPSTRSVTITGRGPDLDGALRSVSGTNVWNGGISVPVQSLASPTRIQVDAGTFTLSTSGGYPTIAPTVSGTPLQFTALGSTAVLNQPRQLTGFVSDVTVNNGGIGTVVFSVANLHTGAMTCSAGTTKLTHANAVGAGGGNNVIVTAGATIEVNGVKEIFPAILTLGNSGTPAIFKISA
jgi:hypothetical protein